MDIQTRTRIMADIQTIMDTDENDKEFLEDLLLELMEGY